MCGRSQAGFLGIRTRLGKGFPIILSDWNKKMGDIPISAFDPQLFQFGSLYSDLVPLSNSSIPI
eukprot:COSAG01_NODE_27240_length_690_cov_3.038917_1_plen_63_part_10